MLRHLMGSAVHVSKLTYSLLSKMCVCCRRHTLSSNVQIPHRIHGRQAWALSYWDHWLALAISALPDVQL